MSLCAKCHFNQLEDYKDGGPLEPYCEMGHWRGRVPNVAECGDLNRSLNPEDDPEIGTY